MIFRIDDINGNTRRSKLEAFVDVILQHEQTATIMLAVSILYTLDDESERVFPKIYEDYSDHRVFYKVTAVCNPIQSLDHPSILKAQTTGQIIIASHGLIHVDHRLLGREGQELSIVVASNLLNSKTFVPPFHKWNKDTEDVCQEHDIDLVRFEEGWKHVMFNEYEEDHGYYYFHPFDLTPSQLRDWLKKK